MTRPTHPTAPIPADDRLLPVDEVGYVIATPADAEDGPR